MRIRTQDGLITFTTWWKQMRVEEDSIIVSAVSENGEDEVVVLATDPDKDKIQHLFSDLNFGVMSGRDGFSVPEWEESYQAASGE